MGRAALSFSNTQKMAARPVVTVQSTSDEASSKQVELPAVFLAPIRPDIVQFVHTSMNKNKRQAYAVNKDAGMQTAAESWGKWHRKINVNQRRYAVCSALAASALPSLVMARGHRISEVPECPLVIDSSIESVDKTSKAVKILKDVGAFEDVEKSKASRQIRSGKGKMRNRRHVQRRGPLVVYAEDNGINQAFRNLSGVEVCSVDRLNLLQLAPGGHLGRFVVFTEAAFAKLDGIFGGANGKLSEEKKGYRVPRSMMTNSDLPRIINSDEVQARVTPAKTQTKFRRIKKNPLKNLGVMVKLNPYARKQKREGPNAGKKAMKRTAAQKKASKDFIAK